MRVLIAGLGSVGKRHLKNLLALGVRELSAYRARGGSLEELEGTLRTYTDLDAALEQEHPEAVLIANPTALHLPVALTAARHGCHLYVEKPLSHTLEGVGELRAIVREKGLAVMVGCNLRFHPGYRRVKGLIAGGAIGHPLSARIEVGQYLPDWHPGEDYRLGYSARMDLGGGAILTLIHELDYAYDLFGDVTRVAACSTRASNLETDVEDLAEILLAFRSGMMATVHVDHVQRPASRSCKVIGEEGTLTWDVLNETVTVDHGPKREMFEDRFERNEMFLSALHHFLDCVVLGKTPSPSLDEGCRVLEIALAAKDAAASGCLVRV